MLALAAGARAHQARLLPASSASGAPDTTASLPSADFTLIFTAIILIGKEAQHRKINQEIRGYLYAFICADYSYRTGSFLVSPRMSASRRTAGKLRLFVLLWKIILSFSCPALWGLWGNGCECAQHTAQLAPISLGPLSISAIKVNTKRSGLNYNLDILYSGNRLQEPSTCTSRHWIHCWQRDGSM